METYVPILLNEVIAELGYVKKTGKVDFLDYCIDISNTSELDNIQKSIDTFENLDGVGKKEMLTHLENTAMCELREISYEDKLGKKL